MITCWTTGPGFSTYDALTGLQLSQDICHLSLYSGFGGCWAQEDTLQFAISLKATRGSVINIYELQPTLAPPLYMLSSFHIPFTIKEFSFSPVSFHASFMTLGGVIVLDVRTSQLLLKTKATLLYPSQLPEFSPNGHFVACQTFDHEIHIWQNGPDGYIPWCNLRARLPFGGFSWSPTSALILGWSLEGIRLLHPNNHSPPLSNKAEPHLKGKNYLVAYSADEAYIATTKEGDSVVTVLDCLWGTTPQLINTDMEIMDIKIVDNAVFVIDRCRIVSWNLGAAGMVHSACDAVTTILFISNTYLDNLRLSPDCSLVAHGFESRLELYGVQDQEGHSFYCDSFLRDVQFSLDGHQVWVLTSSNYGRDLKVRKLGVEDLRRIWVKGDKTEWPLPPGDRLHDEWSWVNLFSYGYYVKSDSEWVTNSRGSKQLWLPPAWRIRNCKEFRWNGNFLALPSGTHPTPIIIKFQPQSTPPYPLSI